jgi:lipopolysaccharide/colanic/teichoic acid biosynthesis glycosyltransferase
LKRLLDVAIAALALLITSPVLVPVTLLVWLQDRHSPFYIAPRVGRGGAIFSMVKLRSMVVHADRSGVDSTAANDRRITPVGHFIRRFKLDELGQLWNVLVGEMSMVGPRPNVKREVDLYTPLEQRLLEVRPGITDFASIVFSDEGAILEGRPDPDISYNQLIRPGKSRLGLFYVEHASWMLDLRLCFWTAIAIVARPSALRGVSRLLARMHAPPDLVEIAMRRSELVPMPPPGADAIVTHRDVAAR